MATKADARIAFLTDLKRVTRQSPKDSETGSVSGRQSGNGIVLDDTLPFLLKQIEPFGLFPLFYSTPNIAVIFVGVEFAIINIFHSGDSF